MCNRSSTFMKWIRNSILALLATLLVFGSEHAFAQYETTRHYVGANLRVGGTGFGLGGEFGWTFSRIYFGLETGVNHLASLVSQNFLPPKGQPADPEVSVEPFASVHIGYYILDWLGIGIVASGSSSPYWESGVLGSQSWFNVGPDLRLRTSEHFEFTTAFTMRPLLKLGFAYLW